MRSLRIQRYYIVCSMLLFAIQPAFSQGSMPITRYKGVKTWELKHSPVDLGYDRVPGWLKLPDSIPKIIPSAVTMDSKGRIYILDRGYGTPSVICMNANGDFLFQHRLGSLKSPHGIYCDKKDFLWVTDTKNHQLYKIDQQGVIVFSLGEKGIYGDDNNHFNKPTDIDFLKDGTCLISDGYGNHRVMKLNEHMQFLEEWGSEGTIPGKFVLPHAVLVGTDERVYIADRDAWRVQIFNNKGDVLEVWPHIGRIFDIAETADHHFLCLDGTTGRITQVDKKGKVMGFFGETAILSSAHGLMVTPDGSIIVTMINGNVEKYSRKSKKE